MHKKWPDILSLRALSVAPNRDCCDCTAAGWMTACGTRRFVRRKSASPTTTASQKLDTPRIVRSPIVGSGKALPPPRWLSLCLDLYPEVNLIGNDRNSDIHWTSVGVQKGSSSELPDPPISNVSRLKRTILGMTQESNALHTCFPPKKGHFVVHSFVFSFVSF